MEWDEPRDALQLGFADERTSERDVVATFGVEAGLVLFALDRDGALSTMRTRYLLWQSAWRVLSSDPFAALFGSAQEGVWYASATLSDLQYPNAHNVFLNQAVYFGWPGAALYLAAFVHALWRACAALRRAADPVAFDVARAGAVLVVDGGYLIT